MLNLGLLSQMLDVHSTYGGGYVRLRYTCYDENSVPFTYTKKTYCICTHISTSQLTGRLSFFFALMEFSVYNLIVLVFSSL